MCAGAGGPGSTWSLGKQPVAAQAGVRTPQPPAHPPMGEFSFGCVPSPRWGGGQWDTRCRVGAVGRKEALVRAGALVTCPEGLGGQDRLLRGGGCFPGSQLCLVGEERVLGPSRCWQPDAQARGWQRGGQRSVPWRAGRTQNYIPGEQRWLWAAGAGRAVGMLLPPAGHCSRGCPADLGALSLPSTPSRPVHFPCPGRRCDL